MSASTTYLTSCPNCGAQLAPHAGHPDAAPWVCHGCHLGFWTSELSHEARELYRPKFHDWGFGENSQTLRTTVHLEHAAAHKRGTSALPEHLGQLEPEHLKQLQRRHLSEEFRQLVEDAI